MTGFTRRRLATRILLLSLSFTFLPALPALAAEGTIVGRVLDPDGQVVPRATVIVEGPIATPRTAITDAEGAFEVTGLPDGAYTIRASSPGLSSAPLPVAVADAGRATIDIPLRLAALDEALVVTATQVDQPLSSVPDSTTVISGGDLQSRQQFSLGHALRSVPGLVVQQSGGPGSVTSLFTRGGESDFTLVLVDGIRVNSFGGGLDLSQVPLDTVDRIEVVRGPQSALYGADAIGGVVQILTRTGGAPSVSATLETGSRDMRRAAGSTTGSHRGFRWQLGGDHFEDEGFTGTASNGETVSNDDARTRQAALTLGWQHTGSGTDLQGTVRYVDTNRGVPGPYGSDPAQRFDGVDRTSRTLTARTAGGLRWVQPWFGASSRVRQRVEFDAADFDLESVSTFPSTGETRRNHARTQTDVALSADLGFTGGVEWIGERGSSTFITGGPESLPLPVERSVLGLFGEARWAAAERLSLTAGVRTERIHRDSFPGDPAAFTPRPDFPAETITSVNPKIAASWMAIGTPGAGSAWTRVHGAFGTGIRPPDAFEIAFTDNSGLEPERSRSVEGGVAQALAGGAIQLDATVFFNTYDDLIIAVGRTFAGSSRWSTDNISNARARGAELSGAWRPVTGLDLRASYTLLDTEVLAVDNSSEAPPPYRVGDRLLRRPRHQGIVDAVWSRDRFGAFAQLMMRGETLDAEPAFGPTGGLYENPGYSTANLGASFRVLRGLTVQGRLLNLFDEHYEEVFGFPAPGRTAYVGVRIAAGR
jgi:outer membrane cobalamin receptor